MMNRDTLARIYETAETLREHKAEILRELSKTPEGYRVFAAIDQFGNWLGAGQVTINNISAISHNKQEGGYVISFYPEIDKTDADIEVAIAQWLEEMLNEAEEEAK